MRERYRFPLRAVVCVLGASCLLGFGCAAFVDEHKFDNPGAPRELRYVSLPPYVIEPPDILLINVIRAVPKPPYHIEVLDALLIQATNVLPTDPIAGTYGVDPDGTVNLGLAYGSVRVVGMTLDQAREAIQKQLEAVVKNPRVTVALSQAQGLQQIVGDHLVRPDGTVSLGTYGSAYIAGMTIAQATYVIEEKLSAYLVDPKVSLDVFAYNSKYYYIIADGGGYGQQVIRLPITGKETVLDAMSQIFGLPAVSSKHHIWVARPNGCDANAEQVLPVDWVSIVKRGNPETNYQLMPGDRIYVQANALITINNGLNQFLTPIERILGVSALGAGTYSAFQNTQILGRTQNFNGNGATVGNVGAPASGGR
jgi:polysaccharide export outer membrane protein